MKVVEKIDDVLYADGWDDCLVGHGNIFHGHEGPKVVAIYDRDKMVRRLGEQFAADAVNTNADLDGNEDHDYYLEADEYISFNVEGAYIQAGMPVFATFASDFEITTASVCGCSSCV